MASRCPSPNSSRRQTPDFNLNFTKSKDIPQRSSVLKSSTSSLSSLRSSFEQNDNVKSRSPSIPSCSKGSKNFMAPTISAASKVTAASPRRKVLQERNEVINSVTHSIEFPNKEESTGAVIDDVRSKSDMVFCSKEESSSVDLKRGMFRTKKFQNVVPSSQIEPSNAHSSLPPYDPKTNYLSPRLLFLHSRPNPCFERDFNREGEFLDIGDRRKLEDTFSVESSKDDVTTLTDEKDSVREVSISENEIQFVSEPEPEVKIKPLGCRPYKRSKLIPFLLVLVLACTYVPLSDSPVISSSMLKDYIHTPSLGIFDALHLSDCLAVVNVNLIGLAGRIKPWLTDSIGYFSFLNYPPKDDAGLHCFFNTTPLVADKSIGFDVSYKHGTLAKQSMVETRPEVSEIVKDGGVEVTAKVVLDENTEMEHGENESEKIEKSVSEDAKEDGICAEMEREVSEEVMNGNIDGYDTENEIIGDQGRNELEQEAHVKIEVVNTEMETETMVREENHNDASSVAELEHDLSHHGYEAPDIEEEVDNHDIAVQPENIEEDIDDASSFNNLSGSDKEFQTSPGLELLKSAKHGTSLGFSLALALLVVASTLVFLYMKSKQIPIVKKGRQTTKKTASVIGGSELTEVSSSLNNTLRKREGDEEQILSNERRLSRDSAASSSISYGSFTTYERRSTRKGSKEEEVVTPVRRSSRISFSMKIN